MNFNCGSLCLILALMAVSVGIPAQDSSSRIESIKADAYAKHPDDVVAGAKESAAALEQEFYAVAPASKLRAAAAYAFVGYYVKNVFEYKEVCAESGVTLVSYPSRFTALHAEALHIAGQLIDTAKAMDFAKRTANGSARNELNRLASAQGTDLPSICNWIEAHGDALAEGAQFYKIMPAISSNLMQPN